MPIKPFSQPFPQFAASSQTGELFALSGSCVACCDEFVCDSDGVEEGELVVLQITSTTKQGQWSDDNTFALNNETLQFGNTYIGDGGDQDRNVWLTFDNVTIPSGARIRKAQLVLTADDHGTGINSSDNVNVIIRGHCSPDSSTDPDFSNQPIDMSAWPRTWTFISWNAVEYWTDDVEYNSPDIGCVIAEIISQDGWSSGNSLKIFIEEFNSGGGVSSAERRFWSYSDDPTKAAQLEIWYTSTDDETMSGGVIGGGSATLGESSSLTATGGAVVGGSSNASKVSDVTASGGVVGGGSSNTFITYSVVPSNGVIANGTSDTQGTFSIATIGGGLVSGDAIEELDSDLTLSGGIVGGGDATYFVLSPEMASTASLLVGGSAQEFVDSTISGGILAGGTASVKAVYSLSEQEGAICSGSASELKTSTENTSGGVIGSSTAIVTADYLIPSIASVLVGGSGIIGIQPSISGGITIGGDILLWQEFYPELAGGIIASGDNPSTLYSQNIASDGAILSGTAPAKYQHVSARANGEVVIGGTANRRAIGFRRTISSGGVQTDGVAYGVYGFLLQATGEISVSGLALISSASYNYRPRRGRIVLGGDVVLRQGQYRTSMTGTVSVVGESAASYTVENVPCSTNYGFPCMFVDPNEHIECEPSLFFYRECSNDGTDKCASGAVLPAITSCRQQRLLPYELLAPPRITHNNRNRERLVELATYNGNPRFALPIETTNDFEVKSMKSMIETNVTALETSSLRPKKRHLDTIKNIAESGTKTDKTVKKRATQKYSAEKLLFVSRQQRLVNGDRGKSGAYLPPIVKRRQSR